MPKHLICPDVSEFQVPLDGTFTRDFLIMRVTFGGHYLDPNFLANANAAKRLHTQGRIAGVLLYVVYTRHPLRDQFESTWRAIGPTVPRWLTGIMIDVETWRGQDYELRGDHSRRINKLYGMHAHRLHNWNSVIAYGNAGDLQELYPGRDRRCRVVVASYGSDLTYRRVRGAIGQQYTNGQKKWDAPRVGGRTLPRASAPFGPCDHNVFPGIASGRDLVRLLRPEQLSGHAPEPKRPTRPVRPRRPVRPPVVDPAGRPAKRPTTQPGGQLPGSRPPAAVLAPATTARTHALVSRNGAHSLVVHDDGSLEVRHRIATAGVRATALTQGEN